MSRKIKLNVKSNKSIVASPMNYIGGKAKLLPQMLPLFPDDINTFYDVFTGGLNVAANIEAERIVANDMNTYVMEIAREFYHRDTTELLDTIHGYIDSYGLSKTNWEAFIKFRADYNANPSPLKLYTLICFSFNYQFRFNNQHEYNNPFGKNRSQFSERLEEKLIRFTMKLKEKNISFHTAPFEDLLGQSDFNKGDMVYLDPPYLITTGSYNDGNRGFKNWTINQEKLLLNVLDKLDGKGVKFALSNVIEHKGHTNDLLCDWASKYQIHYLDADYSNSSHNTSRKASVEVLVTNY